MLRLINDHDSIEKIAEDFDDDKEYIQGVVTFLQDIGWMRQTSDGHFKMTMKGKSRRITRQRSQANFGRTEEQ